MFDKLLENVNRADMEILLHHVAAYGMKLLGAILIFVVGRWVAKVFVRFVKNLLSKSKVDQTLVSFAGNGLYVLLLAVIVIAALGQLGVQTTSLAAIVGAAGLAIGLSLQGSLANLAEGVMIIIFRPFKVGDTIEGAGVAGKVNEITLFTTVLKTDDNRVIIIPNSKLTSNNIMNSTAQKSRRIDLVFRVSYEAGLKQVKEVLAAAMAADDRILKVPAPEILVKELGERGVSVITHSWVKTEDYGSVMADLNERVKLAFDKAGIVIPRIAVV